MPNILLSGPAGAGKSALASSLLATDPTLSVLVDYTGLWAALTGQSRGANGAYPTRQSGDPTLALVEYQRQQAINAAVRRELGVIATNSDGDPSRRERLLAMLSEGEATAVERIVDPGRAEAERRLAETTGGVLSHECEVALDRWYGRLGDSP